MDREVVLLVLLAATAGPLTWSLAWRNGGPSTTAVGGELEAQHWRELWMPVVPTGLAAAALAGWLVHEPADSEWLPWWILALGIPTFAVWLRAVVRAIAALRVRGTLPAATIGLLRPRIVLRPDFVAQLDEAALAAAVAHETAHVRHHDPLRIWLAQVSTDLQWPAPAAQERLRRWLTALESARDDEARAGGIVGDDLAAAILGAAALGGEGSRATATLAGANPELRARIERLLADPPTPRAARRWHGRVLLVVALLGAMGLGASFGEAAVRALAGVPG